MTENILEQLERLAAGFPWDGVELWVKRKPEGTYHFTSYVKENPKFGSPALWGSGKTPEGAVDDALRRATGRDPEEMRQKAIKELQDKIAKLQAVEIGPPPYVPNRELALRNTPPTIEV
jgi:hypothetical protein